jgi:DNA gyrase subunit B
VATKTKKYSEDNIERYAGLAGIRKKPTMYAGPMDDSGLFTCLREPADNCVDQALAGRNSLVHLVYDSTPNKYWVIDDGEGIPVGKKEFEDERGRKEKLSTFYVVTGLIHGGGNFSGSDISRGCFVGSQKVKLLNGKSFSFEKLYERFQRTGKKFWVYSFDINGDTSFVPRLCTQVHKTMLTKQLCDVTLDSGRKIRCTPDHPFLTFEGEYVEAQYLEEGQRLRALYTSYDKDGYEIHSSRNPRRTTRKGNVDNRTARTVMAALGYDIEGAHVHHVDGIKTRNIPKNLEVLFDRKEHFWEDYHDNGKHQDFVHKTPKHLRASKRNIRKLNTNPNNGYGAQFGKMVQCAARALRDYGKLTRNTFDKCRGWCYPASTVVEHYLTWGELKAEAVDYLTTYGLAGRTNNGGQGLNYKLQSEYTESPVDNIANHFVTKVRMVKLKEAVPVYDLTVEGEHNYLLDEGVFVHNTHGVGLKLTNALSTMFKVWTFRDKAWWAIEYSKGKIVKDIHKTTAPKLPHGLKVAKGTIVCFEPELELFAKKSSIKALDVQEWCELTSYLVKGLTVKVTSAKGKTKTFKTKNGVLDFIEKRKEELKCTISGNVFQFASKDVDVALAFSNAEGSDLVYGYTNGLRNKDGGEQIKAVQEALVKSLAPYKGKLTFTASDLREGLVGLVNAKLAAPRFNNQTKDKLLDDRVYPVVNPQVFEALEAFWKKNKQLAKEVCTRAAELRKRTADFLKDKKLIKKVKSAQKGLSAKLADVSNSKTPIGDRELYLVEGDSAGGSAKVARYRDYQATFSLKGKPLNVMETTKDKVNNNAEIAGIFAGIGLDLSAADPISKIRFGKIIFLADADVDGSHINTLLLTLFWKYLPDLYKQGRIYIVDSPEYLAKHKGKLFFASSKEEIYKQAGTNKLDIRHLKGWGETNAEDLQPMAFDPNTRKLFRVLPPRDKNGKLQFEALMGRNATYRQKLLNVSTAGADGSVKKKPTKSKDTARTTRSTRKSRTNATKG